MQHSSITLEVYFRKVWKLLLRRLHHSDDIFVKSYVRIILRHPIGPNFLTQGVELLPGEVWQVSKQNSQHFRSYLRKTTGGPLGPLPPAGRGLRNGDLQFWTPVNIEVKYFLNEETEGVLSDTVIYFSDQHLTWLSQLKPNAKVG